MWTVRGHGTSEIDGRVVATICGVVERVNKLVYVRPLRARSVDKRGILARLTVLFGLLLINLSNLLFFVGTSLRLVILLLAV